MDTPKPDQLLDICIPPSHANSDGTRWITPMGKMQFQRQIPKRTRYQAIEQFATASVVLATSLVMLCGIPIDRKFNFNLIPAVPLRRCFLRDNHSGGRRIGGFSRKKKNSSNRQGLHATEPFWGSISLSASEIHFNEFGRKQG